jgi:hypothetical protein
MATDPLEAAIDAAVAAGLVGMDEDGQAAVRACLVSAFEPLSAKERLIVAASELNPTVEEKEALEAAHPGLLDEVEDCVTMAEPDTEMGPATTMLSLPDGRELVVVDSSTVEITGTGYRFVVGDKVVIFEDGKVTVDGAAVEVPEFAKSLEIKVDGGEVVLTGS